jgi:hypothetical protein
MQESVRNGEAYLLDLQKPDGHWCGELEGDTILETAITRVIMVRVVFPIGPSLNEYLDTLIKTDNTPTAS